MSLRWLVRQGDPTDLPSLLARLAPRDPRALAEGRVFVGRARASASSPPLRPGDEVTVQPRRVQATAQPVLIATRHGLAAFAKPAGLATIADHHGSDDTLHAFAARALGLDQARLHPTSRLDLGVSGVVVFALDAPARERLASAREDGLYARSYVALSSRPPDADEGDWDAPIGRAPDPRLRAARGLDAVHASTHFRVVAKSAAGPAHLALSPRTGRTHQLRVHCAHAGAPLLGDRDYGGPDRLTLPSGKVVRIARVALHALRVEVPDERGKPWPVEAPVPDDLAQLFAAVGLAPP